MTALAYSQFRYQGTHPFLKVNYLAKLNKTEEVILLE